MDGRTTIGARRTMEEKVMGELKRHFRPEFLNRVDDTIIFHSLDETELTKIVDIQLVRVVKRLAEQNLTLVVDDSAKKLLASEGYDPQFGARPLKRAIQDKLLNPLATRLLAGDFKPGDAVKVSAGSEEELIFEKG
jgi:ATP-dependent Clp protease ATP-binding subunit ClpB